MTLFIKNKLKILEQFFEFPEKNFHLRQLSRLTQVAVTSTKKYLGELLKEKIIMKDNETIYPSYKANQENKMFKLYKQQIMMQKIYLSEVITYISENTLPKCIVLFGSACRGEHKASSDIDLFVQAPETKLEITPYEKKLKHKVNLLFEPDLNKLSKGLLNNILSGIVLSGQIRL